MPIADPRSVLLELIKLPSETEWVEFKKAENNFDFDEIGRYFSALGNEANLKGQDYAWLIFGVTDKIPRSINGTNFRKTPPGLDRLKFEVSKNTNHQLTFVDIHDFEVDSKRVILFQIPSAPRGIPMTWRGIAYGRSHESLGVLNLQEIEEIRNQAPREDWSAAICPGADLDDLDHSAIRFAREQYKVKNPNLAEESNAWDDLTFLNKAKICVGGRITNAAVILLGKPESAFRLSPALAQITWVLRDRDGVELDYHHWGPPFILAVDQVLGRLRNLTVRVMPSGTLFPMEITQYDPWVLRECLHNCIAHQDYSAVGRINLVENPDSILFTNLGDFIPGSIENVICSDAPPNQYRNPFLAHAMVNFNMIDTIGSGIKRIFSFQKKRFFPMPDYTFDDTSKVKVRLYGKILDENYTKMLIEKSDLTLTEAIALDKVQKGYELSDDEFRWIKERKLIEGRRPNVFVSAKVAAALGEEAAYIKHIALEKPYYKKLVITYLERFKSAKRQKVNDFLLDKLSDTLDNKQKYIFIKNLLQEMRREGLIVSIGKTRSVEWRLANPQGKDPI